MKKLLSSIKNKIQYIYYSIKYYRGKGRIFILSIQKTGTTSTGDFFRMHGKKVAGWPVSNRQNWSFKWMYGDFEAIFNSKEFLEKQVFEDSPWWCPEFYKYLYHRFPKAQFILVKRDSRAWFESMNLHSEGKTPGNTIWHTKIYRREADLVKLLDTNKNIVAHKFEVDNLLSLQGMKNHYRVLYELHNREVEEYFAQQSPKLFLSVQLESEDKWRKMADFTNIMVENDFDVVSNKSRL